MNSVLKFRYFIIECTIKCNALYSCNAGGKRCRFDTWVRKIPWRRKWQPLQYSCLENPWQRSLVGYSPYDHTELDTTEATQQACTSLNINFSCIYILEVSPYIILYESRSVFLYEYYSSLLCVLIPGLLYPLVLLFSLTFIFCLFSRPWSLWFCPLVCPVPLFSLTFSHPAS